MYAPIMRDQSMRRRVGKFVVMGAVVKRKKERREHR